MLGIKLKMEDGSGRCFTVRNTCLKLDELIFSSAETDIYPTAHLAYLYAYRYELLYLSSCVMGL